MTSHCDTSIQCHTETVLALSQCHPDTTSLRHCTVTEQDLSPSLSRLLSRGLACRPPSLSFLPCSAHHQHHLQHRRLRVAAGLPLQPDRGGRHQVRRPGLRCSTVRLHSTAVLYSATVPYNVTVPYSITLLHSTTVLYSTAVPYKATLHTATGPESALGVGGVVVSEVCLRCALG